MVMNCRVPKRHEVTFALHLLVSSCIPWRLFHLRLMKILFASLIYSYACYISSLSHTSWLVQMMSVSPVRMQLASSNQDRTDNTSLQQLCIIPVSRKRTGVAISTVESFVVCSHLMWRCWQDQINRRRKIIRTSRFIKQMFIYSNSHAASTHQQDSVNEPNY